MAQVRKALTFLLERAEPNGALVMDRRWDLLMANRPWRVMAELVLGRPLEVGENMLALTLREDGFRRVIVDWEDLARGMLHRMHREATLEEDAELLELLEELAAIDGVPSDWRAVAWERPPPLTAELTLDLGTGAPLRLFTTLTTLGTPTDVTLSELRLEHYFPLDAATEADMNAMFG